MFFPSRMPELTPPSSTENDTAVWFTSLTTYEFNQSEPQFPYL